MTVSAPNRAPSAATAAPPARRRHRGRNVRRTVIVWGFLFPGLLLFAYFKFIPMFTGLEMSFHEVRPFLGDVWGGLDNYVSVLTNPEFGSAIWHTIVLGVGTALGAVVGGFVLALLLEGASRYLWFIRTAAFLPVVTATAVIAEVWRIIYFPAADGYLNSVVGLFGVPPVGWLTDPDVALWSVMIVGIWQGAPYNMVIILAGLAGVDRSLYEAAAIDGVNTLQRLRYIVIPALRPAFTIVIVLAAIKALRVFTDVWVLTSGGPSGATEVWMTLTYSLGFERNELGLAAAASIILLVATVVLTLVAAAVMRRKKDA
ncbi:carbohydrate ABC transporter permease [Microbacterium halophytorum]|uniref:carbohydrate ABC transporter permease n=1 Tax=Microbacterium halophytorum TaxID=2067568 RepID=UPI000CFCDEED|nr:sugar ABC transporter permease [Microbacterium halophytorum]